MIEIQQCFDVTITLKCPQILNHLFRFLNIRMFLRNLQSQFLIVTCFSKSLLLREFLLMIKFSHSALEELLSYCKIEIFK